ncbi:MAG: class I SAM-dependent methyltransferase [Burkholderiales bacterium]|nr:class I SAM-dependent methyltransferase [Burkholderiales bacterium]
MENQDPDYYDHVNWALLRQIPAGASVVVEVGCGTGRVGEEYKKLNPGCAYYGIELSSKAAALAAGRLDMVFCGTVESVDLGFLAGKIDCVVYGDVLEHLIDPWAVLKGHADLLKPGGKVAACIPNVLSWNVVFGLLRGQWTYTDHGQLDRTHLRFFTLPTMQDLFAQAGLTVDNIGALHAPPGEADAFIEAMKPSLAALGINQEAFAQHTGISQYVLVGSRPGA